MGKASTYALSHVFEGDTNSHEEKELVFEAAVQTQTDNEFEAHYDATCKQFVKEESAEKFLGKLLKKGEKRNFGILWIDFDGLSE